MIGTRLAHYEITAHLGSGGMGDVYAATDSKLGRSVALKLLPGEFAADAERLARFRREAQVLASLNHHGIAAIHGFEDSGGRTFLVMELVDGETLQSRLKRGAVPIDEALTIAKQIAEALEAAHDKGIVHRDLKPGNVMLTADGRVKVLDFGLAKAYETNSSNPALSNSPTMVSMAATNAGVILGTAAYMSPEQAKGRPVDKRTDIFAFGCVLYETLTGKPAFDGEDITEILGAVVRLEPDWTKLPKETPSGVRSLLRLCLEKDVKKRRRDAGDVWMDIERALTETEGVAAITPAPARTARWQWIAGVVVALLAGAGASRLYLQPAPNNAAGVRFTIPPPIKIFQIGASVPEIAVSPDGKTVVFQAMDGAVLQLWVRAMDSVESRLLPGTNGATGPFWSPDSKFIGFSAGGKIKTMAISGGSPQSICDVPTGGFFNAAWGPDGSIVFGARGASTSSGLFRVSAAGGTPSPLTSLNGRETAHVYPFFLPDGRHFLYTVLGNLAETAAGVYVGSLDSKDSRRILDTRTRVLYSEGHLLMVRDGKLMAQPFDPSRLETRGEPVLVADGVGENGPYSSFSVADAGVLAFGRGGEGGLQPSWFDRTGRSLGPFGEPARYRELRLSPDGRRVALVRTDPTLGTSDLWLAELSSGVLSRFTSDPTNEQNPLWSPDGRQIAFLSTRKRLAGIYLKTVGSADETALRDEAGSEIPDDWTKDGRYIIFRDGNVESSEYALPMFGDDRKPVLLLKDPFIKDQFKVSPDGRWIAYNSGESEKTQVYVAAFPSMTERHQVSSAGGGIPKWRGDGKELYYLSPDGKLMAVDVKVNGAAIETGAPKVLFQTPIPVNLGWDQYDVTADGQKFLMLQPTEQSTVPPLTVITNWLSALHRN